MPCKAAIEQSGTISVPSKAPYPASAKVTFVNLNLAGKWR